jgi:hypothetical protein
MGDFRSPGEIARARAEAAGKPEDWEEFLNIPEETPHPLTNINESVPDSVVNRQNY